MFLGIDQGTTGTTAVILSSKGKVLGGVTVAVPQHFPQPGWVEHDAEQIWKTVQKAVSLALKKTKVKPTAISAIGITNQRETVGLFEGDRPLHRFIVWQDRRTADICKNFSTHASLVQERSGLPIDPYFSSSKILWLKKKLSLTDSSNVRFRTIDSFLIHRLTGADVIELTNASRTSLLNLHTLKWDRDLLSLFEVPPSWCPRLVPSEGYDFKTKKLGFLPAGIPVVSALGDQQAALFGQCAWKAGEGKITFGTGSFILMNVGFEPVKNPEGLVSTLALARSSGERTFALEGSVFNCGSWIDWMKDQAGLLSDAAESEKLAKKVKSSEGVYVIPALTGLGAPFWNPHARGVIGGLTRGSSRAHIARASLEALAFQNRALIELMVQSGLRSKPDGKNQKPEWRVDGGVVKNNLLMQIQSNILGANIVRPKNLEATATGAALLAALSTQRLGLDDIRNLWKVDKTFTPDLESRQELEDSYQRWKSAARALTSAGLVRARH